VKENRPAATLIGFLAKKDVVGDGDRALADLAQIMKEVLAES
jgi:hypothetical protein